MARTLILPGPDLRYVVVHYHIMKNAGSTLVAVLEREFGDRLYDIHRAAASDVIGPDDLAGFIAEHSDVRAITSHHIRYPLPAIPSVVVFDCCFLRDPLDRLESLYTFLKKTNDPGVLGQLAANAGVAGFLSNLLEEHPHQVCNPQTNLLANGGRFVRPPDANDLQRAVNIIKKCALPGLVDRFDESLTAAEYFWKPAFPALRLHHQPHNVVRSTSMPLAERHRRLRAQCGAALFRQVWKANELDQRLYTAARRELDRRIGSVPSFPSRLEDFRRRCSAADSTLAQLAATSSTAV
jgi:hypothetical protein